MRSRYHLIFLILIGCQYGFGQNRRIDSLKQVLKTGKDDTNRVNTLNALSDRLWRIGKYDTSMICANNALALAEKKSFKKGIAKSYNNIGIICYRQGDYPKALEYFLKALKICEETGDKSGIARNTGTIGLVYYEQGDYPNTLDYYFKASKIYEELGDKNGVGSYLGNVGNVYYDQHDYPKALEYYFKALKMFEDIGDKSGIETNTSNIGMVYNEQVGVAQSRHNIIGIDSLCKKALVFYFKALKMAEEAGDKREIERNIGNIGNVYNEQENYSKAFDYYFKALKMCEELGDSGGIGNISANIGSLDIRTGKIKEAEEYLKKAIVVDSSIREQNELRQIEEVVSHLYDTTGRYKLALIWYKKAMKIKDSLFNIDKDKALTRKEVTYQFEKKEAAEKGEQDKKDFKQKIITWSVLGGLILVLAFAGFIFRSLNITRKQKTVIEQQKFLVEEKNKEVLDSITYAKRLQDAILPPLSLVKQYLPESFLLYKPKDIVAGDFYWMERTGDSILIAAADCTGHGVPGAMVSVVCSNALNRTVKEFKIIETGKILDKVRELVLETFEKSEDNVQDGMDISLCCINTKSNEAQWSGAYNSLWYIHNAEVIEVPADKQPIGKVDKPVPFNTHNLNLQKGDTLYLFTDGYADQFGGPKGKKFKYKQLQELLLANAGKPMDEQKKLLESSMDGWKGGLEQVDDILVIGIRI